jgi:DNA repair ATPase RecN
MDAINVIAAVVGLLGLIVSIIAQVARSSEKAAPYSELLKQIDNLRSRKPISTQPINNRVQEAVKQLMDASASVSNILSEIQTDVERKLKEAERLSVVIEELQKKYNENTTLAHLSEQETAAVRQLLTTEVSSLKRRSYVPDILINFGVGAFFFILGIIVSQLIGP